MEAAASTSCIRKPRMPSTSIGRGSSRAEHHSMASCRGNRRYRLGISTSSFTFGYRFNFRTETLTFKVVWFHGHITSFQDDHVTGSSWPFTTTPTSSSRCRVYTVSSRSVPISSALTSVTWKVASMLQRSSHPRSSSSSGRRSSRRHTTRSAPPGPSNPGGGQASPHQSRQL